MGHPHFSFFNITNEFRSKPFKWDAGFDFSE